MFESPWSAVRLKGKERVAVQDPEVDASLAHVFTSVGTTDLTKQRQLQVE